MRQKTGECSRHKKKNLIDLAVVESWAMIFSAVMSSMGIRLIMDVFEVGKLGQVVIVPAAES
jgi:hypothetical protein